MSHTTTSITYQNSELGPPVPEWLRLKLAVQLFGISRSKLYELIDSRRIKSICLREKGALKGIRLINADSLRAYLDAQVETLQAEQVANT